MLHQLQVVFLVNHLKRSRYRKISPMIQNNFLVKVGIKMNSIFNEVLRRLNKEKGKNIILIH